MVSMFRWLKQWVLIPGIILLSQCAKGTEPLAAPNNLQTNQALVSPYTMPAKGYLALAKNQTGIEKQSLIILAAGRLIHDGRWQEGGMLLRTTHELSPVLMSQKRLLLANIDLIKGEPRAAIAKLAGVHAVNLLPLYYQAEFHDLLASAYQSVGNTAESLVERIKLDQLLPNEVSRAKNHRALWLALTALPLAELDTLAVEASKDSVLKGWVQLALVARQLEKTPEALLAQLQAWQARYPSHPGNSLLPSPVESIHSQLFAPPRQIALLLPLTGPLAGPGAAVRDGFMAAYEESGATTPLDIRLYNTETAEVSSLYQQALTEGAQYIVGPLSKANVTTVAGMNHPVPTLLLNEAGIDVLPGAYQFGLSPGDEAAQVALRAQQQGYTRVLIIAPSGDWGHGVVAAFTEQWRLNGGAVVDTLSYDPSEDLNAAVRRFLHIPASESRQKQLRQLLGHDLASRPEHRQDFDVIFLLAYPSKARQIMPLLNYYYAGDVPVYSISTVYAGSSDPLKDKDLDGLIFCDMPSVFSHPMGLKNWPEQFNSYARLYALGRDSYALATGLNRLLLFSAVGVSHHSGILYLASSTAIARLLVWGQFKQGMAEEKPTMPLSGY